MSIDTPWGKPTNIIPIAEGITSYTTASHGGIHLSPERQEQMPEVLRLNGRWYEEDCNWCLVAVAFPTLFIDKYEYAVKTLKNWHPDRYEKFCHVELKPGESYIKDERLFKEINKDKFIMVTACGSWHSKVPTGMVGVWTKRPSDDAAKYFLIPESEYSIPFAVDEDKYTETKSF